MGLYYQVLGGESYEGFHFAAILDFPGTMEEEKRTALFSEITEAENPFFAMNLPDGGISLRGAIDEQVAFEEELVLNDFLIPFLKYAEEIVRQFPL